MALCLCMWVRAMVQMGRACGLIDRGVFMDIRRNRRLKLIAYSECSQQSTAHTEIEISIGASQGEWTDLTDCLTGSMIVSAHHTHRPA